MVNPKYRKKGDWERVRQGRVEGLHMLAGVMGPSDNVGSLVVDFRQIYSLPLDVDVLDHLMIGQGRWLSLRERGWSLDGESMGGKYVGKAEVVLIATDSYSYVPLRS